jgi:hypothetical protein
MDKNHIEGLEPYEAPTVEDVPIRPEETMFAACKGNTINIASGTNTCQKRFGGGPCFAVKVS